MLSALQFGQSEPVDAEHRNLTPKLEVCQMLTTLACHAVLHCFYFLDF